jgi:hypothetical protein
MTTISDHYDNLELRVALPNEQVIGELHGRHRVTISVLPGHAERAGETEMEAQLARLARLLFAHRAGAFQRLNRTYLGTGHVPREERPQDERFREAYDSMAITGSSEDHSVRCSTVGLKQWTVDIRPGTIAAHGSAGLARAATEAGNDLVRSALAAVRTARHDAYASHA